MSDLDKQTFFSALGFLAVVLNEVPLEKRGPRAAAIASLIESFCATSSAIDDQDKLRSLVTESLAALELCLECEGLTWEAEQAADICVERSKQLMTG